MRRQKGHFLYHLAAVLALAALLIGCGSTTASDASGSASADNKKSSVLGDLLKTTKPMTVPEGTTLAVVLDEPLSSADSRGGDSFAATIAAPVVIAGKTVIPKGARAKGRVIDANASGHLKGVAKLELALESIEVGNKWYDVATDDSTHVGQNHNKHNLVYIGGGTAGGALIGGLAGGKGALIGSLIGAGGGTAASAATGKKDIRLPAETRLSFQLNQPVTIPVKG